MNNTFEVYANSIVMKGCGSDAAVHWYSLSTDMKPDWISTFASRPEIQSYWQDLTSKHELRRSIRFNTNVESATWDDDEKLWVIAAVDRQTGEKTDIKAKMLVSAIGILAEPNMPKLGGVGLEGFKGVSFHSARWNHDVELRGKRIAVIGNGCSAYVLFDMTVHWLLTSVYYRTQFVPIITEDPAVNVVQFCRTPMWYIPRVSQSNLSCLFLSLTCRQSLKENFQISLFGFSDTCHLLHVFIG